MRRIRGQSGSGLALSLLLAVVCAAVFLVLHRGERRPVLLRMAARSYPSRGRALRRDRALLGCACGGPFPHADATGLVRLFRHGGRVEAVRFSPDGRWLAAVGGGRLDLWCAASGERAWSAGSKGDCLAFSPDGRQLAVGGERLEIWQLANGTMIRQPLPITAQDPTPSPSSIAYSPDGRWLVGGGDLFSPVSVWDTRTWHEVRRASYIDSTAIALDSRGHTLAAGSTIFDFPSLRVRRRLEDHLGDSFVHNSALSPDGRLLVAHTEGPPYYVDRHMVLWDTKTGQEPGQLDHSALCVSAAFSPDGRLIATGGDDDTVRLWNTRRQLLSVVYGHDGTVNSVCFSPDGRLLASGSYDGTVRLWDVSIIRRSHPRAADPRGRRVLISTMRDIAPAELSKDGRLLLSHDVESNKVWSAVTGRLLHDEGSRHYTSVLSPDGTLVARFDDGRGVVIRRSSDWKRLRAIPCTREDLYNLRFSVATGGVRFVDVPPKFEWWALGRDEQLPSAPAAAFGCTTYSGDGRTAVKVDAAGDGTVWRRNGTKPLCRLQGSLAGAKVTVVSPHGDRLLEIRANGRGVVWDLRTGRQILSFDVDPSLMEDTGPDDPAPVAFSPDGRWLVSWLDDVRVWDTLQGRLHATLKPYAGGIDATAFSPDSRVLATGGENGRLQLWNLSTAAPLHTYTGPGLPVQLLAFTPCHRLFAFGSNRVRMVLWQIPVWRG